jgi:hypothetical protein
MFKATHDKPAVDAAFEKAGISIVSRAEELPTAQLVNLSNALASSSAT